MVEFLVTKGKLVVRNGEPLIVVDGEEKALSKSEFILWTSLNWKILNKESLEKEFDRRMKKYGIDSDSSFEQTLNRLKTRGLVAGKSDYLAVDALYNLVKDLYVVPLGTVNAFKRSMMFGIMLIEGVPFNKCREAMEDFNLNCLEKQIVGFSKRLKVSGAELIRISDKGLWDIKSEDDNSMRYYVTADVHGYFSELKSALAKKGFFEDKEPHKLIICGDIYDRGTEALELQNFILDLMSKDEVILIRGNHEDLTLDLLNNWDKGSFLQRHYHSNGTVDTICQLTETSIRQLSIDSDEVYRKFSKNPFIQNIIPAMVDFYETEHYIFTHGWIPCDIIGNSHSKRYIPIEDWRNAGVRAWDNAKWTNGMEAAHDGIVENGKTIVCGHWHCSFGHAHYDGDGGEFDNNPNFTPYYGKGIIALDACTPVSKMVNCIVIED